MQANPIDVLALQETKTKDADFPADELRALGYAVVYTGQPAYNGVALISRAPSHEPKDTAMTMPGVDDADKRVIAATYGDLRVVNFYVVNGQEQGTPKYDRKMQWLESATAFLKDQLARYPQLVVVGDFNIIPEDRDAKDPDEWRHTILATERERDALQTILDLGFVDTFRLHEQPPDEFSWWPYWRRAFESNKGARIDLILASSSLAPQCASSIVDKVPRGWQRPSDHAPVVAEFRT